MLCHPRFLLIAALVFVHFASSCCDPVVAQDWVKAMFSLNSHDFGTVARGSKAKFSFELENKYEEDVHITGVRTSCGCTTPSIKDEKYTLKTYEKGEVVCQFNTDSFIGSKAAVVTVIFDKPFYGEMQLNVKGNIRSDISTEPGEIQFGDVPRGTEKNTSVKISYLGPNPWEIKDVRSANKFLGVQLLPIVKQPGRVEYEMKVRLKPDAPVGAFNDEIVLVTNESNFNKVTVPVRGKIPPPLEMADSISLGTIVSGQTRSGRLIVKGLGDFSVKEIKCSDDRFRFRTPGGSRKAHIVPIDFTADAKVGAFRVRVTIETDLPEDNSVSTYITGNVAP